MRARGLWAATILCAVLATSVSTEAQWWRWFRVRVTRPPVWTPPIGIPAPSFGIEEVTPTTATRTISGTLPSTITVTPGDVVQIAAGTYGNGTGITTITGDCTAEQPCFVSGAGEGQTVIQRNLDINGQYTIIEDFTLTGVTCGGISIEGDAHHVAIRDATLEHLQHNHLSGCTALVMQPDGGMTAHDLVVYDMTFDDIGMNAENWDLVDEDYHAVAPTLFSRSATALLYNIWVLDSRCAVVSGNCVQVNAGNWANAGNYLHHVYIGRNVSHSNRQAGFWSKQATDVIISQNTNYDGQPHPPGGVGDCVGHQYTPDYVWFIFNNCYDNLFGVRQSDSGSAGPNSSKHAYVIGNIFRDGIGDGFLDHWSSPPGWGVSLWQGILNQYVLDNTIVRNYGGIEAIFEANSIVAQGNLISERIPPEAGHAAGRDLGIGFTATAGHATADYNLVANANNSFNFYWATTTYTTLAAFKAGKGQCLNCITTTSAGFVDLANNDFRLAAGSPAIDAGMKHAAYDVFEARYGRSIAVDFNGTPRPSTAGDWDIGAFEYVAPLGLLSPGMLPQADQTTTVGVLAALIAALLAAVRRWARG